MMETLKREEILRDRRDVVRVLRHGRRVPGGRVYLRWLERPDSGTADSPTPPRRVAFLLARGIGSAVRRNRLKRRLREFYRRNKELFPAGRDYLVHAAAGAADCDYGQLDRSLRELTGRRRC